MLDLGEHQDKAICELDNGKILWGGVGTGKSRTAVGYYLVKEAPRDVYVITTAKKRDSLDWDEEFAAAGIGREVSTQGKLTVDSWNNIGRYTHIRDAFFIFDEQRLVGSGAWTKAFLHIAKSNRWILLSATPGDTWMDYVPVFLANGFYKNRTQFKHEHVVYSNYTKFPKIDRYLGTGKLVRLRKEVLVEMPFDRETLRIYSEVPVEYDKSLFDLAWRKRFNPYEERPIRDVAEAFVVARRITNDHVSRVEAVLKLLEDHPRLIVFYNFDYELERLRTLGNVVPMAEWNGHKHQPIPQTDRWIYIVQYQAGAEGWNCIETDTIVYYSQTYSWKLFHQAGGRTDRLNTSYRRLYHISLMSESPLDRAVKKALKTKQDFQPTNRSW